MDTDPIDAIRALLVETEEAHGRYETTELGGVYDQDWPRWYAAYAVEHGIGVLVGHEVTADRLASFLAATNLEFQEAKSGEAWAAWTARRAATDL
jgi:hypothetical protein